MLGLKPITEIRNRDSKMTDTKQEEIWETYPEFNFIEVSNLGRIRSKDRYVPSKNGSKRLAKGHILKQYQDSGYMRVKFKVNGETKSTLVHRMVATCFIPNPDNLPEVNHIDNDRTNNVVSNLEWCTRQYNQDYKSNFGTSPAQLFGRPVFAVNLKTGKVLRFETQSEAARQLGIPTSNINMVIKGKMNTAGWYWFTEDESEITDEKIQEIRDKMHFISGVIAINPETSEVFWFESQREAGRQLGFDHRNINNVLKGKQNTAHGYCFYYADENTVEKTRTKFGDKIAEKVEELMSDNL